MLLISQAYFVLDENANPPFSGIQVQGKDKTLQINDEKIIQSKKISNDQELIQSDPISCPQNQKGNN